MLNVASWDSNLKTKNNIYRSTEVPILYMWLSSSKSILKLDKQDKSVIKIRRCGMESLPMTQAWQVSTGVQMAWIFEF